MNPVRTGEGVSSTLSTASFSGWFKYSNLGLIRLKLTQQMVAALCTCGCAGVGARSGFRLSPGFVAAHSLNDCICKAMQAKRWQMGVRCAYSCECVCVSERDASSDGGRQSFLFC